jgi:hypothetical protein
MSAEKSICVSGQSQRKSPARRSYLPCIRSFRVDWIVKRLVCPPDLPIFPADISEFEELFSEIRQRFALKLRAHLFAQFLQFSLEKLRDVILFVSI